MNDKELRELDAWIASYIFMFYVHYEGRVPYVSNFKEPDWNTKSGLLPEYTTDPAAVMVVLEKCLKNHRPHGGIVIYDSQVSSIPCYTVSAQAIGNLRAQSETLPLAICLFAKQLFTK